MVRGSRFALALAVLLVFAGATPAVGGRTAIDETGIEGPTTAEVGTAGATATQTTTEEPTPDESEVEIETEGFDPDYDPAEVLGRVEELRGLSAIQGITLHEYDGRDGGDFDMRDKFGAIRPAGAESLQLYSNASTERRQPLGYTVERQAAVHIYLMDAEDLEQYDVSQQTVLAHEFVHALQFQHELLTPSRRQLRSEFVRWTTDTRLVTTALVEGDAMWVTEQYVSQYGEGNYSVADYNRTLDRSAWPHSVAGTPYYYGYEYYAKVGSDPQARSDAIQRPPNGTAGLLHPGETVEMQSLPDPPTVSEDDNLTRYHTDTVGELVIRHALRINGLSFTEASAAADGWANDRMYYYAAEGATGPAIHWVTVWENDTEASEFADSWQAMLEAAGGESVGDETVVVPASDHAPRVYYVVEREGSVVEITTAPYSELAGRLAEAANREP